MQAVRIFSFFLPALCDVFVTRLKHLKISKGHLSDTRVFRRVPDKWLCWLCCDCIRYSYEKVIYNYILTSILCINICYIGIYSLMFKYSFFFHFKKNPRIGLTQSARVKHQLITDLNFEQLNATPTAGRIKSDYLTYFLFWFKWLQLALKKSILAV